MRVAWIQTVTAFKCLIPTVMICAGCLVAPTAAHAQIAGYETVANQVFVPASSVANVNVACSAGKNVLGGGFSIETPVFVRVFSSEPSNGAGTVSDHNWNVLVENTDPSNARQVTVSAICAMASTAPAPAVAAARASRAFAAGHERRHATYRQPAKRRVVTQDAVPAMR